MSGKLPSVVGRRLDCARQLLGEVGGQIERIEITNSPAADYSLPENLWRVVQQRSITENKVRLVVAREISLAADNFPASS